MQALRHQANIRRTRTIERSAGHRVQSSHIPPSSEPARPSGNGAFGANARRVEIEETIEIEETRSRGPPVPPKKPHLSRKPTVVRATGVDPQTGRVIYGEPEPISISVGAGATTVGRDSEGKLELRRPKHSSAKRFFESHKEEKPNKPLALRIFGAEEVRTESGQKLFIRRARTKAGTVPVARTPPGSEDGD